MLVSVVGSRREGAINSNLVHLACVPVRRASTERSEESEESGRAINPKEVSSRMIRDCKPPLNPVYRLTLDQSLLAMLLRTHPVVFLE
jgi:hypothetical protein